MNKTTQIMYVFLSIFMFIAVTAYGQEKKPSEAENVPNSSTYLELKAGERKCGSYVFKSIGGFAGMATYQVTKSQVPAALKYSTETVKAGLGSGITIDYCIEASANAEPGIYGVTVHYSFYSTVTRESYATEIVKLKVKLGG